ncbi:MULTISPECIES: DegT/DnrJ/EryC1/StrS family aminotransferase [unclassified Rhizobium]|nr:MULTISPECIES: DegT/DnrJ/EryC1/StrS family aminotransferase [unclassified Rhizobium]MDH7808125.1 dTDP-4-amino-4,6-dideoxygalactose transaminase [Rhizobium sp. AN67]MDQ4405101.1 DegT/DnrJ/EryC1/StrS family aminotransferase [Rhizobium sp. AN63]SOD52073.1 dTDP-4-amino-4,6-dideoxygalactose transaminase [Rhizobium sp. AN6A]
MKVPFLDLKAAYQEISAEIDEAVHRVLDSGWYILGEEIEAFEAEFSDYCQVKHTVALGNGLEALHLGLRALGVETGDEVIVPSNTYVATWLAVSQCGAKIIPVEPDPFTHNIDAGRIEAAITDRTKVILPVHLYGLPADMGTILDIASRHRLKVLEDAAQAHGAVYDQNRIGGHGHVVAWSFYPSKNLGALGDAGAITTNDDVIADKIRMLRNYGTRTRYVNEVRGYNSRMDPLQAAVLRVKLKYLDRWNERRASIASRYIGAISTVPGIVGPNEPVGYKHAWHLFVIRHLRRDSFAKMLNEKSVGTIIHYPIPPHMQTAYSDENWKPESFPVARRLAGEVISLPIGPQMSDAAVEYVADLLHKGAASS